MKRSRNPELKRQKIIEATHQILREGGYFTNFSMDSVARAAGVSKGGLMHHFQSKDALMRAAAQDAIDRFEAQLERNLESADSDQLETQLERNLESADSDQTATPKRSGKMLRAYVETVLGESANYQGGLSPILLSYLNSAENTTAYNRFQTWQQRTEQDGLDILTATIVRLTLDGIIYTELIDGEPISADLRQQIKAHLLAMLATGQKA